MISWCYVPEACLIRIAKGITIEVRDGRNGGLKHMLKVSISLQKNIEAAALGVILIAKEKNFIQVNVRGAS